MRVFYSLKWGLFASVCSAKLRERRWRSLVSDIKDLLSSLQTTVCDLELWLVEGLGLVKAVTVRSSELIGVLVLLSLPGGTIPELAIALVATLHGVRASVHLELSSAAEVSCSVTGAPVRLVVNLWVVEASTSGGHEVVLGLMVLGSVEHGASAIPSATDFHGRIILWNQLGIESVKSKRSVRNCSNNRVQSVSTYPVVEKPLSALSRTSSRKTSRDCSVILLPRYWLLTLTRGM